MPHLLDLSALGGIALLYLRPKVINDFLIVHWLSLWCRTLLLNDFFDDLRGLLGPRRKRHNCGRDSGRSSHGSQPAPDPRCSAWFFEFKQDSAGWFNIRRTFEHCVGRLKLLDLLAAIGTLRQVPLGISRFLFGQFSENELCDFFV